MIRKAMYRKVGSTGQLHDSKHPSITHSRNPLLSAWFIAVKVWRPSPVTLTPVTLHLWCQKWDLSIQCCSDGTVQIQSMVVVMVQLQKDEKQDTEVP